MKRTINEHWQRIGRNFSHLWSGNRRSMMHQEGPAPIPPLAQLIQAPPAEPANLCREALSIWEDDGGHTSLSVNTDPDEVTRTA